MVCSAGGMVLGGFLAADPSRCERIVGAGMGLAALVALTLALGHLAAWMVPVLFGVMGFASGIAGPSRGLLVKRSTPANASGRVYGVVCAGLDIGQAVSPLIFVPPWQRPEGRRAFMMENPTTPVFYGPAALSFHAHFSAFISSISILPI